MPLRGGSGAVLSNGLMPRAETVSNFVPTSYSLAGSLAEESHRRKLWSKKKPQSHVV